MIETLEVTAEHNLTEIICFYCHNSLMAVDLYKVIEISNHDKIMRIPHSAYFIEGIANLRGEVTPIVNLRRRFHFPVDPISHDTTLLVYDYDGTNRMAMIIDEIDRVYNVKDFPFTKANMLMKKKNEGFVKGFYIIDDKIITVLDIERIAKEEDLTSAISGKPSVASEEDELLGELEELENEIDNTLEQITSELPADRKKGIHPELQSVVKMTEEKIFSLMKNLEKMLIDVDNQLATTPNLREKLKIRKNDAMLSTLDEFLASSNNLQDLVFSSMIHLQYQDIIRQKLEKVLMSINGLKEAINFNLKK